MRTAVYRREAGLFSLALIGLLLAASWAAFSLTRWAPALGVEGTTASLAGPRAARITYRHPAADGSFVSLDLARQSVRLFTGQDGLALEGGLERGPFGPGSYAIYYLESAAGGAGQQTYRIDARSGEVLEMTRFDLLGGPDSANRLTPLEAEARAERFVANRFLGFSTLSLVERTVAPAANGNQLYVFKWAMIAAESGAELPTSVTVSVSSASGEVVWYLAQRDSTDVDARPAIPRETAIATAAVLVDRGGLWDARAPTSVRLQVIYNQENRQQLVWAIVFPSKPDAAPDRPSLRILIDAKIGEPVSTPS